MFKICSTNSLVFEHLSQRILAKVSPGLMFFMFFQGGGGGLGIKHGTTPDVPTETTGSGFGRAGPLQELTAGCRELLNQVGRSVVPDG